MTNIEPSGYSELREHCDRRILESTRLPSECLEQLQERMATYRFIPRPFTLEPLPSPMDFYPMPDREEASQAVSKFSQHINESVKYVIDSEALKVASEMMRQTLEKLSQEIARQSAYNFLVGRLCFISRLPRRVVEERFREYCEANPEKSPDDNFEDIRKSRAYLQWDVINKNCKFFSGNEHLKCAVNPGGSCLNCRDVEERKCKYFLGSTYLKCAVNPSMDCSECSDFEE